MNKVWLGDVSADPNIDLIGFFPDLVQIRSLECIY